MSSQELAAAAAHDASSPLERVRDIAVGALRPRAPDIDRKGEYPVDILRALGAAGAFAQHHRGFGATNEIDVGAAIDAMGVVAEECLSTAFCVWCQDAFGWYVQNTDNESLRAALQAGAASGAILGGTGLSNPLKALSGIEPLRLRGRRVAGGYRIDGALPWVSNMGPGHYFGVAFALEDDPGHLVMALARDGDEGISSRQATRFIALDGTATVAVGFRQAFIADERILADPVGPFARKIRPGFILLQTGMALGLVRGSIALMRNLPENVLNVNRFLPVGPGEIEDRLFAAERSIAELASTPLDESRGFLKTVLEARLEGSALALEAAQAGMLHAGARAYVEGSAYSRRLRESYFIAIVTPATKHLEKDIALLGSD
ncbi:putative acyl-CoA dehydrogenase [Methylocella silvestris BL2]|uniref:Putative acyl-CoA dehydrogenase n=1 Tax=Methylocella silvestris (strain DSM 15510 / CIP 108128 / LMG 27833 / NCIMB 13906 / BL2) TaxID=395965 RepID=B8ETB3_METSB|nr:acyl-CoA dehydrogenase family protein [Methylocella silvestris]ACK51755.1 putative acyl-CoA dehydrogenase [Methylocella silvestris BL2]